MLLFVFCVVMEIFGRKLGKIFLEVVLEKRLGINMNKLLEDEFVYWYVYFIEIVGLWKIYYCGNYLYLL